MGRKPVNVNRYEAATDRLLTGVAVDKGDRLLLKMRLADVVDVEHLPSTPKWYAMSAHLDFVMVNGETSYPRFAVELDGAQHWTDPKTRRRDELKDEIAEKAGLPLLRITSDFIRHRGQWTLLTWATESYYLAEGFLEAQEGGYIPWDEPFDPENLSKIRDGRLEPISLASKARSHLRSLGELGQLPAGSPNIFIAANEAERGVYGFAMMAVAVDRYVFSKVRVRDFLFFGVSPGDLAEHLVTLEIYDLALKWLEGEPVACNGRRISRVMSEVQSLIDQGGFLASATCTGAMSPGGILPGSIVISHRGQPL